MAALIPIILCQLAQKLSIPGYRTSLKKKQFYYDAISGSEELILRMPRNFNLKQNEADPNPDEGSII
jgi:hypothetical protein